MRWVGIDEAGGRAKLGPLGVEAGVVRRFGGARGRTAGVRWVVVGPARFNAGLAATGSKAKVHFAAFARLLGTLWDRAGDGVTTWVRSDKHGGRHFYYDPLLDAF